MKLCITCKNCQFGEAYAYSEYTADNNHIHCYKRSDVAADFSTQEGFLSWNSFAERCSHYEAAK